MHRSVRRCIQEVLYAVVLLDLLLVLFVFPIALVNRTTTVPRTDHATRGTRVRGAGDNGDGVATPRPPGDSNGPLQSTASKVQLSPAAGHLSQESSFNQSGLLYLPSLFSMLSTNITAEMDLLTCRDIDEIALERAVGKGTTKYVYKSVVEGRPVAIKVVTEKVKDISACRSNKGRENIASCFQFANYKVLKEIALLQQLRHPNVAKLLGYCIRSDEPGKETVRLVMEYGKPINIKSLEWPAKLKMALDLAELLHFLHRSPMGPLRIGDFKRDQFRMIDDTLKLSDLDDLTAEELTCTERKDCSIMGSDMGVPCVDSVCKNFNTVANVKVAKERFFNAIFSKATLSSRNGVAELLSVLSENDVDTKRLRNMIALFREKEGGNISL